MKAKTINTFAWWLIVVGGLNWGLVGLGNLLGAGNWNVVQTLLSSWRGGADLVYIFVGVATLLLVWEKMGK